MKGSLIFRRSIPETDENDGPTGAVCLVVSEVRMPDEQFEVWLLSAPTCLLEGIIEGEEV